MGMFDRVVFTCPSCGASVEVQSKSGDCMLDSFGPDMVPIQIAASIEGDTVHCESCNGTFVVCSAMEVPKTVSLRLV